MISLLYLRTPLSRSCSSSSLKINGNCEYIRIIGTPQVTTPLLPRPTATSWVSTFIIALTTKLLIRLGYSFLLSLTCSLNLSGKIKRKMTVYFDYRLDFPKAGGNHHLMCWHQNHPILAVSSRNEESHSLGEINFFKEVDKRQKCRGWSLGC